MPGNSLGLQKAVASELANLCLRHSKELNALLLGMQQRGDDHDLEIAKRIVGRIMGEIYVAAFYPIFRDFPDLKPEGFP
jgi:hypothetical protein